MGCVHNRLCKMQFGDVNVGRLQAAYIVLNKHASPGILSSLPLLRALSDTPCYLLHPSSFNRWDAHGVLLQFDMDGFTKHPPAEVGEITLNMRTGKSELRRLQPGVYGDFPRVRQDLIGATLLTSIALLADWSPCIFQST